MVVHHDGSDGGVQPALRSLYRHDGGHARGHGGGHLHHAGGHLPVHEAVDPGSGRGRRAHGVPFEYEPRDPHALKRHHRPEPSDGAARGRRCRHERLRESARQGRPVPAIARERYPGHVEAAGRQGRFDERAFRRERAGRQCLRDAARAYGRPRDPLRVVAHGRAPVASRRRGAPVAGSHEHPVECGEVHARGRPHHHEGARGGVRVGE